MLRVLVLGPVEVRAGSRRLRVTGAKQRTLLARLALAEGRSVSADALVEDLWDRSAPADPAHALQAHVSRLRSTLSLEVVHGNAGYRLPLDGVEVDAHLFADLARNGRELLAAGAADRAAEVLSEALSLWRGPALSDLAGVPGLRSAAVRLDATRLAARTDRIDADIASGRHRPVLAELEALLEEDPLHERAWLQLMVALHREGRQRDALDAYQRARTALVENLGIEPGEQLARAHQAVLEGTAPTPEPLAGPVVGQRPSATRPNPPAQLPPEIRTRVAAGFTGRDAELSRLDQVWARVAHGPHLVVVSGEPGIGKTRLATEFAARCHQQGGRALFGRCDQALSVPAQPFIEMLRGYLADVASDGAVPRLGPSPGPLTHLVPELADVVPQDPRALPQSDPDTERYQMFDAVARWLAALTVETPALLVLDDLHWADRATALLVRHLLHSPHPVRALLVATYRDREHPEDGAAASWVADLLLDPDVSSRMPLARLAMPDVSELLRTELTADGRDEPPSAALSQWVDAASGGNPLFVVELARQIQDGASPSTGAQPHGVRDVVAQRLGRLPTAMHQLLRTAAVIGRSFDPQVLQQLAGLDDAGLDRLLSAASYTRLIERCPGRRLRYMFSHDLVRAELYEAVPPMRRARLHRCVAEVLEQAYVGNLRPHYNELAHHFSEAALLGSSNEAVRYLSLAGQAAEDGRAPAVATEHYRAALDLLDVELEPGQRCDLMIALGSAQRDAGQPAHRETLLSAAELARQLGDGARLTEAALANSRGWWSSTSGVDQDRLLVIEDALRTRGEDEPYERAALWSAWAMETVRDPARRLESVHWSKQAVAIVREVGDVSQLASALAEHYAVTYASFTDPHRCAEISAELVGIARTRRDLGLEMTAAVGQAQATALLGEMSVADRFLDRAEATALDVNHHVRLWMVRSWKAMRLCLRGRLDEAEQAVNAAFELGAASGQPDAATWFAGQLFTVRWHQGRLGELIDAIEEQVLTEAHGIPAWRAAYALALAELGRKEEAAAILDDFVDSRLAELPHDMLWLQGMAYLSHTCHLVARVDAAPVLYQALEPYADLLADNGTINAGPVAFHLGLLAELTGDPEGARRHLEAAEAMCDRIDAPLWLEKVRQLLLRIDTAGTRMTIDRPAGLRESKAIHSGHVVP